MSCENTKNHMQLMQILERAAPSPEGATLPFFVGLACCAEGDL